MNLFEKAFCRVFQFCFHLALPILPYREPQILNSVEEILPLCQKLQLHSVLLVTDQGLRRSGNTKVLEEMMQANQIHLAVYDKTSANPTVEGSWGTYCLPEKKPQSIEGIAEGLAEIAAVDCCSDNSRNRQ